MDRAHQALPSLGNVCLLPRILLHNAREVVLWGSSGHSVGSNRTAKCESGLTMRITADKKKIALCSVILAVSVIEIKKQITEQFKCEGNKYLGPRKPLVLHTIDQTRRFPMFLSSALSGSCSFMFAVVSLLHASPPCPPLKLATCLLERDMVTVFARRALLDSVDTA